MKNIIIVLSAVGGIGLGLGIWWWFKTGRYYYFVPSLKIISVNKKLKRVNGKFGNKYFTYIYEKGMAMNVPGERGFEMTIREAAPLNPFPTNLNFIIKKGGKVVQTPTPF